KETRSVELCGVLHKTGQTRYYAPGNHNSCDPLSRAPAFDDKSPRYLKKNIRQVKHPYAEPINSITETQVGAHPEIGERNIDPVDVVHEIEEKDERKQAKRNVPSRPNANFS